MADNEKFVSLVDLTYKLTPKLENEIWDKAISELDIKDQSLIEIELFDLFSRIERSSFLLAVKRIWQIASEETLIKIHLPHPRHDMFLIDLGYVNPLIPESFLEFDPRYSLFGHYQQLGVRLEIIDTQFEFDESLKSAIDDQSLKMEELEAMARQSFNVIQSFQQTMKVKKSLWIETAAGQLPPEMMTPDIEKQLREQYQHAVTRGDLQAAQVIQNFLKAHNK